MQWTKFPSANGVHIVRFPSGVKKIVIVQISSCAEFPTRVFEEDMTDSEPLFHPCFAGCQFSKVVNSQDQELKAALLVAAEALEIASDWNVKDVQCHPPKEWMLPTISEDPLEGWCSTYALSIKLRELGSK